LYYGKNYKEEKSFTFELGTINKGTFASLREEYGKKGYEAFYIITPVAQIYKMLLEAGDYPIGCTGILLSSSSQFCNLIIRALSCRN
jgi:hypothetical protein